MPFGHSLLHRVFERNCCDGEAYHENGEEKQCSFRLLTEDGKSRQWEYHFPSAKEKIREHYFYPFTSCECGEGDGNSGGDMEN